MLKSCLYFVTTVFIVGSLPHFTIAEEPHEVWLKYIEGTWTWNDEDQGKATLDFETCADGKCVLGKGKDETGTFAGIIGWEAGTKTLTDTGFHSNGGSVRIVYHEVTATTLKGVRKGSGPGGSSQPDAKFHVVRDGSKVTVTSTDPEGVVKTTIMTKQEKQ